MTGFMQCRLAELHLAIIVLTRLPAGRLQQPAPSLVAARWAYPLVGLIVGTIFWMVFRCVLFAGFDPLVSALTGLAVMVFATGGLHHDGLADFVDGVGGGRDKADCLSIMRDSRTGSYGVLALLFVVFFGVTALGGIGGDLGLAAALLVSVLSRLMMLGVLVLLPPARTDGLGHDASGPAPRMEWVPGCVIAVTLIFILGSAGIFVLVGMAGATFLIVLLAQSKLKGQTGDVLGAVQLTSETAGWVALSVVL